MFFSSSQRAAWLRHSNITSGGTSFNTIHIPIGKDGLGLPIGVQMIGGRFREALLLRAAYFVEQASGWPLIDLPPLRAPADMQAAR